MNKDRLNYAISKGLGKGIFFAIFFSLLDAFDNRYRGTELFFKRMIFAFCFFIVFFFIWSYFEYKCYRRKLEEKKMLAPGQFRCFKCQTIIESNEDKCPKCGWTWR
jgi:hypothetical protein